MPDESLLRFPCTFPIKIIGKTGDAFEIAALGIITHHAPDLAENAITTRQSADGHYTSITVIVPATSQAQLDAIYLELTACDQVIMAL